MFNADAEMGITRKPVLSLTDTRSLLRSLKDALMFNADAEMGSTHKQDRRVLLTLVPRRAASRMRSCSTQTLRCTSHTSRTAECC